MYGDFLVLFAMILTGYILRKINCINDQMNGGLNKFILYFAYPCLIVYNVGTMQMSRTILYNYFIALVLGVILLFVYAGYAYGYGKLRHYPDRLANVAELSVTASNNGFMGFPVALIFFGQEGLFMMMAANAAMNIFYFSYGIHAMRRNNHDRDTVSVKMILKTIWSVLINPNIVALFIGFGVYLIKAPLENAVGEYLLTMGRIATPMSMVFIGSTLAGSKFLDMFKNRIVWGSAINKLIMLPAITIGICYFLPIDPMIKGLLTLSAALPSAATTSMMAEQEGANQELASKILFFTTVLSMATLPLAVGIINKVFGI
ncbi:MAG: AEC family transporter [Anaerovoracaceae bacterium]